MSISPFINEHGEKFIQSYKYLGNGVYRVELDEQEKGMWFKDMLIRETDYEVIDQMISSPVYWIKKS